jgi:PAS domain S-box-containing protein
MSDLNTYINNDIFDSAIFEALFTNIHTINLIVDPETSQIVNANNAACQFYGYTHSEITSMYLSQINTLSIEEIKLELQAAKEGQRNHFIFKHKLKNGEIKDVEIYSGKIILQNKEFLFSVIHDITRQKVTEEALKTGELKLRTLLNTMTEGVALNEVIYNENHEMVDYKIIEVNNAFYKIADYSSTTVINKLASDIYGMSTEYIKAFWEKHKFATDTAYIEMKSPLSNKWFYVSTSPIVDNKFVTSFFDITERKQAEEQIKENEAKLKSILNNL